MRDQDSPAELARELVEGRALLRRVLRAMENDRRRIARDIHNRAGQQMTALRMGIDLMATAPSTEQTTRTRLLADTLDRTLDALEWELWPTELDRLGLAEAMTLLVEEWSTRCKLLADCDVSELVGVRFASDVESTVYRIAQDALHNIARQARANYVHVAFARSTEGDTLTIRDERSALGPKVSEEPAGDEGLVNMRDRAALIGGTLAVESDAAGTIVRLQLPRC